MSSHLLSLSANSDCYSVSEGQAVCTQIIEKLNNCVLIMLFWQNDLISNVLEANWCRIEDKFFGIIYGFHLI